MYYIIAKDNLNRDYHPDRLVASRQLNQSVEDMQERCDLMNHSQDQLFYTVITDLSKMNLESMYDCAGEIPSFSTFCSYTGLGMLPHDDVDIIYRKHFNL